MLDPQCADGCPLRHALFKKQQATRRRPRDEADDECFLRGKHQADACAGDECRGAVGQREHGGEAEKREQHFVDEHAAVINEQWRARQKRGSK